MKVKTGEWAPYLRRARQALGGDAGDLRVLEHAAGAEIVAFLVTLHRQAGDLVAPLTAGRTLIGRRSPYGHQGTWPEPSAVEGAQWVIECDQRRARISDSGSTNLSVLLPAAKLPEGLDHGRPGHLDLESVEGAMVLLHPNKRIGEQVVFEPTWYDLTEGCILRSFYATFIFGWLHPG